METVAVNLKSKDSSYDILISPGCLGIIGDDLGKMYKSRRFAVITDSNVRLLYGDRVAENLRDVGLGVDVFEFPAGEVNKTRETKACLEDEMQKKKFGRDSVVVAVGGGVVGDVAGFVAATYNRGVPFVQVPTTMMAQIDASVGGKVAVDTPHGKNLVGMFYQPKRVYIDPNTLKTLPRREFTSGMAEAVKHAMIFDRQYFEFMEKNAGAINRLEPDVITKLIHRSCELKAGVVMKDEKEENLRAILNFGHTIGHAIENLSDYSTPHGYAVSVGSVGAGKISVRRGILRPEELERYVNLLQIFGLPTDMPDVDQDKLIRVMRTDKKAEMGKILFVLPSGIGEMATIDGRYKIPVSEKELVETLFS